MKIKYLITIICTILILISSFYLNSIYKISIELRDIPAEDLILLRETESIDSFILNKDTSDILNKLKPSISADKYAYIEINLKRLNILNDAYFKTYNNLNDLIPNDYKTLLNNKKNISKESKNIATFEAQKNKLKLIKKNKSYNDENENIYNAMWNYSKKLIPNEYMSKIKYFQIISDGSENSIALVSPIPTPIKYFNYSMDPADALTNGQLNKETLTNTIIHEFGHILTLNSTQMDTYNPISKTYNIDAGTLKKDSYLNLFYEKFWKDDIENPQKLDSTNKNTNSIEFFLKFKTKFVSDYAATNPAEDIAESFMTFVVKDKPTGKTIADDKVRFFYDFEELVKMRDEIRSNMEK